MADGDFETNLASAIKKYIAPDATMENLVRLTAGASQETWSFDAVTGDSSQGLILRRPPRGVPESPERAEKQQAEVRVLKIAYDNGVLCPEILFEAHPEDDLGVGFVMDRIEGETMGPRINRDDQYAEMRKNLAYQCGVAAATIHAIPIEKVSFLETISPQQNLDKLWETYQKNFEEPSPVFEAAFSFLKDRIPTNGRTTFVHGDFRHGNLMYGTDGLRSVLDWEIVHIGDPMEDLSWICVNSWRFGGIDLPVGGFGQREDLFAGYEAESGIKVDPSQVRYWEVYGSLRWGVTCRGMAFTHLDGHDRSVERAAIGRRSSECEADLMILLGEAV
ncbi:MAG: phosphotransferase family protein [Alphaproteobacteria bacterium]|nr:MAG: phosphotransferase family protein [Alphaproteobacteria bacterium]